VASSFTAVDELKGVLKGEVRQFSCGVFSHP
jgi:hypothetical protein